MKGGGKRGRQIAIVAAMVATGIGLGLASAWLALSLTRSWGTVQNGPWRTLADAGSPNANPYTRASVAINGLLALDKSETIYFVAAADEQGHPLDAACDYRVEGRDLGARWWSLTLYGADRFLVKNNAGRYSFGPTSLAREADGGYIIRVSARPTDGNWLPSGAGGRIFLALRLYNPAAATAADPAHAPLPHIVTERCP
jgi:hypothetical protein